MVPAITIIIIGRNESLTLEKCIISALNGKDIFESKTGEKAGIVYVDSQSCDNSKEIAKRYGLVIYVSPERYHTCSNARNTGLFLTQSDLVMFLDGDMELNKNWLYEGFIFLKEYPLAGGVIGIRDDYRKQGDKLEIIKNYYNQRSEIESVIKDVGGAVLYRRKALEDVGGFEPAISPEEDYVLFSQLSHKGWKLFRIKKNMIIHWDMKIANINSAINHLFFSHNATMPGVILRHAFFQEKWSLSYLLTFKTYLIVHSFVLICLLVLIVEKLYLPAMFIFFLYLILCIFQKENVKLGIVAPFTRTIYLIHMLIGFILNRPVVAFGIQHTPDYRCSIAKINKQPENANA